MNCDYCQKPTVLVDSSEVYGKSYGLIYLCRPCKAYVGVHKGTTKPIGRLANAELREWKKKAHAAFDPLWNGGDTTRKQAYKLLASALGMKEIHIGESDVEMCKKIISAIPQVEAEILEDNICEYPDAWL